jgi:aminoglycoside phosphotransferase (APT) family kinase protein
MLADETRRRVVVRRPSESTAEETQRIVAAEYALLSRCAGLGLPAPKPCFLDHDEGAVVLEYVDGAPEFAPPDIAAMLEQMAAELARIHAVEIETQFEFLPRLVQRTARALEKSPQEPDTSLGEPRLREVLSELWPWPQHNRDCLLHGDYWPGNLLWQHGKLSAVLDWEEAKVGDPLGDVAIARLDILWAFGESAMHAFTAAYRDRTKVDWRNLALWDLRMALRPMSNLARWAASYPPPPISRPDITEQSMREGHRLFVAQALQRLREGS